MTAGTGGLLAGTAPLDEHVSRLPSPQQPPSTPIPSLQTLPCIPAHSADRSAGWNAGWDDLDGLAGTERYSHPTQRTAIYPATDFGPPGALSVLTGSIG